MSFVFRWIEFDKEFYSEAKERIEQSLNEGPKPANICAPFEVKDFYLGSSPPRLELTEIVSLSLDAFKANFSFAYNGNGYIVLNTKVQANPVTHANKGYRSISSSQEGILAANKPLIVPMQIRITDVELEGSLSLSYSLDQGLVLAFLSDPLMGLVVSSTFDSLPKLRLTLQREIEERIRDVLFHDLPKMLQAWSQSKDLDASISSDHHESSAFPDLRVHCPSPLQSPRPSKSDLSTEQREALESVTNQVPFSPSQLLISTSPDPFLTSSSPAPSKGSSLQSLSTLPTTHGDMVVSQDTITIGMSASHRLSNMALQPFVSPYIMVRSMELSSSTLFPSRSLSLHPSPYASRSSLTYQKTTTKTTVTTTIETTSTTTLLHDEDEVD